MSGVGSSRLAQFIQRSFETSGALPRGAGAPGEANHLSLNRSLKQQRNRHRLPHRIPLPSSLPYEHEDFLSGLG